MRDNRLDTTIKDLGPYYVELSLDCECFLRYNKQSRKDSRRNFRHEKGCSISGYKVTPASEASDICKVRNAYEESDMYGLNSFAMEDYELRPILYLEYIFSETPNRMKNIFAGLECDPLLTVGLWDKQEGLYYGEKVPYLQCRQSERNDDWETVYRHADHEKIQEASFDSPYLGYPRQDCEKEEEYRSLIHLTDDGLLVLGGQGPDRGPDWRGGGTFQSTHKEYRRLPCLEFVIPDDPRSGFVSNLIADGKLAVNVHRGDGSVYTTDPNCCEYLQRDLKPGGLWEQQQVPQRSLRHFCLDHLPLFKQQEVLICTVAMKITEDTKDMLMGNEEDFVEVSTAFDLIHRILCNKGGLVSLNHVKNLHQLSEVYDDFIDQNFERQDVKHLKRLRQNGLFALTGPEFHQPGFKTYKIPLLKIASPRGPSKARLLASICQDRSLPVGSWNAQDGKCRAMNIPKICGALRVNDEDCCFPKACKKKRVKFNFIDEETEMSLRGSILQDVEPLKDANVSIWIIAMRVDKLIHDRNKTKLLSKIKNFDIARSLVAHLEAVNSVDLVAGVTSSRRTDDSDEDDRSHPGIPQQVISGLTTAKELSNQPGERRPFDINFDELLIKGITPLGEFWLHERNNAGNAYIFRKTDIPHTLRNDIGVAKHLERIDAQSLSRVNLRLIEVKAIAVGRGGSTSILVTLRGEDQLFVLSKTTLYKALSKKDAENFENENKEKLEDADKRRASYVKWREGCQ